MTTCAEGKQRAQYKDSIKKTFALLNEDSGDIFTINS